MGVLDSEEGRVLLPKEKEPGFPNDMLQFIAEGKEALKRVREAVAAAEDQRWRPSNTVQIIAPIPRPSRNVFCVGKNYSEHAQEFHKSGYDATAEHALPTHPIILTKAPSSVIGPGEAIRASDDQTASVDYEAELAVVIGRGGRSISSRTALDHIFGYTIVNDITSRTLQNRHKQWFLAKSLDTFCPMGPALVTVDEIENVGDLELTTHVNDELRQRVKVSQMIFDIPTLIATISSAVTLEPGDIIATGTPSGVGIGFSPPRFLKPGDIVTVGITGLGKLTNPVI